jgi:subtilisin family serine protease
MQRVYPVGKTLEGEAVFQMTRPKQGLFVPRIEDDQTDEVTASLAVMQRTRRPGSYAPFEPKHSRTTQTLESIGLLDSLSDKSDPPMVTLRDNTARLKPLKSVGMMAAQFLDMDAEREVVERLNDDYIFVPDFELAMPSPLEMNAGVGLGMLADPDSEGEDRWWDESGIGKAHASNVRGQGVLMGILDTGVDIDHDNFRNGNRPNKSVPFVYVPLRRSHDFQEARGFDPNGHGTHVCGIISGRKTGIAPKSTLCVASVIESETTKTSFLRVIIGLHWLLGIFLNDANKQRPAIINLSLGFPPVCPPDMSEQDYSASERLLARTIDQLYRANVLVVGAIGNDGEGRYRLPGAYDRVLGVGAVDYELNVANFSGSDKQDNGKPDVVGYGVNVFSSWRRTPHNDSTYVRLSGTSMACPYAASIAALYWSMEPNLTNWEVRQQVMENASPVHTPAPHRVGSGLARFVR